MFTHADRRALRAVATQFFVNGAVVASFMPRMPEIRDQVGITVAQVGLLLSVAGLFGFLGSALVGRLIEALGSRLVLILGGTLMAGALAVVGLADTPIVLFVGLALMATFDVVVDAAMNLQASWLSGRRRRPVMNRLHGAWSVGTLGGGLAAAQLAALDLSVGVHLLGAAAVIAAVLVYVGRGLLRQDEPVNEPAPTGRHSAMTTGFLLLAAVGFAAVAIESTSIDWAAFRFADDFGASPALAALGYAAVAGGMTAGRLGGDHLAHRLGADRLLYVALGAAAVGLALATLVPNRVVAFSGFTLTGLGAATMLPRLYDEAAKWPGRPGAGLGALTAGVRGAFLTAPLFIGGLAGAGLAIGSAMAVFALPAVALFWFANRSVEGRTRRR